MRVMKDSGVEWIGEVPSDWELKKIKYTLKDRVEKNNPVRTTDILSLTAKQGVVPYHEKIGGGNKPKEDLKAYRLAFPGDIVMNSMNILSGAVGLSKYFGCVSPVYYMLRPQNKADDVRYYNYIFQTTVFQRSLFGLGNGILIKESSNGTLNTIRMRITMDKFGDLFIPIAPQNEQEKIANFLDEQSSEIDSLIFDIKSQIEVLEQYKKSIITEAVTTGLDKNVEMKDSGIEWIGSIPRDWDVHPVLFYFAERKIKNKLGEEQNLLSLSYGKIKQRDINQNGGLLPENFNTYNIIENQDIVLRLTDLQNDKKSLRTGLSTQHGIITSAYVTLKPIKNISSKYHHYLLHSYDIQKVFYNMGNGVRQGLTYTELSKLMLINPPINEQNEIVEYLENKCTEIEETISEKQTQISTLEEYKKSIIFEYVTGKKEVL